MKLFAEAGLEARVVQIADEKQTIVNLVSARIGCCNFLDRFDIEQDSSGLAIKREVIKQIGDIDDELVADRNNSGETHCALRCPLHHASGNSARLRDQRQISRTRHVRGETCIEVGTGHHDAKTIWSYQPHSIFLRGALGSLRQRSGAVAKARGDNERARRAP